MADPYEHDGSYRVGYVAANRANKLCASAKGRPGPASGRCLAPDGAGALHWVVLTGR
jgi:hypothetical protein